MTGSVYSLCSKIVMNVLETENTEIFFEKPATINTQLLNSIKEVLKETHD